MSRFCNLHVHSEGSFLDGYSKVDQIARRAKELGQVAVALTDHGEVNQHLAFQKACRKVDVKPIFGMEGYWAPDIQHIRDFCKGENSGKWGSMMSHLCLIAKNDAGLKNLWALSSTAYDAKHFYQRPMADPDLLRQYSSDLFASDGCIMTALGHAVKAGDEDGAKQYLGTLQAIYGERFYVELHTWQHMAPSDDEWVKWSGELITTVAANQLMTDLNRAKVRLATEMGIPMVVVNDAHHAYPDHWQYKQMVWGFKKETNPDQQEGNGQKADHMMADDELFFWMDKHGVSRSVVEQAIEYSGQIADQCEVEIKPLLEMPKFTKSEEDDLALFLERVEAGFKDKVERGGLDRERYWARMESEVKLIAEKRFSGYFLVVEDYVRAARTGSWSQYVYGGEKVPMLIGPGRGSAGGSLVSYLLGITSIDPLKYGLLFERFLSPGRKGYPDIDIDFPRSKRKGVRDYIRKRWGEDRVCSICTMTRNQAKASVRDLARALGIDNYGDIHTMATLVDKITTSDWEEEGAESAEEDNESWSEIMEKNYKELSPWIRKYPELFDKLNYLHGIIRSTGVHAAAVLISEKPFAEVIPTRVKKETLTTQFDMYDVEELGGLKGDILALRHLDALEIAAELIKERHGVEIDYEAFTDEQYSDPAIWEQIDDGRTVGIFQIGTPGGTDSAIEFRPRSQVDVADLISINRPGVRDAGLYHVYLRRRAGVEPVVYQHPMMESITKDTFGVLIYQEQLMFTAIQLAGFTADESDDLRKAVGKKLMEKVLALKDKFVQGCMANAAYMSSFTDNPSQKPTEVAETIWASIEASGRYLFNKSHAIGYALVSTWEIWVKHYYPSEFLVACLRVDEKKRNKFIRDARRQGISILPPDVNLSPQNFTIDGNNIRYGLQAVFKVGDAAANKLAAAQPFTSVEDFLKRGKPNKTVALNLARLGALDGLGAREVVFKEIERYRAQEGLAKSTLGDPDKLRAAVDKRMTENPEKWAVEIPNFADDNVVYAIEQELIGTFVTIDPMGPYLKAIDAECVRSMAALKRRLPGSKVVIGGEITKLRVHTIKKGYQTGKLMCFLGVEWQGEEYDITVFPPAYEKYKLLLSLGSPVMCGCERLAPRNDQDGGVSLVKLFRLDLIWKEEHGN